MRMDVGGWLSNGVKEKDERRGNKEKGTSYGSAELPAGQG